MPRTTSTFTYRIPSFFEGMLVPGQLVFVPWRGGTQVAIIESLAETTTFKRTATLIGPAEDKASLSAQHIAVLRDHAHQQGVSYATLAMALLPEVPKRAGKTLMETPSSKRKQEFRLKTDLVQPLLAIAQDTTVHSVWMGSQAERIVLYTSWIQQTKGQTLVLVPTVLDAQELAQALIGTTNKRIGILAGVMSKHQRWKRWQEIQSGAYDVVIATRSGVFAPLQQLQRIIIDQEEDQDHRSWEASPYYDSRLLARALAKNLAIPLNQTSFWPRVESWLTSPWVATATKPKPCEVFIHKAQEGLLHRHVEEHVANQLAQGRQVLIVSSQVSAARAFLCLDCQYRWTCSHCGAALCERNATLACDKCGLSAPLPTQCPRCDSTRLQGFALGLEALAKQLPSLLGRRTHHIDAKHPQSDAPILLTTPYAWRRILASSNLNLGAMVLFHPEKTLFSPDYRAQEWFMHLIHWHRIMAYDYFRLPVLIQTDLEPPHPLLTMAVELQMPNFVEMERQARERMALPPFGESMTVTAKSGMADELRAIGAQLRQDFPGQVYGSVTDLRDHSTAWLIKFKTEDQAQLDKLNNSIYSKLLLYRNPETPLLS